MCIRDRIRTMATFSVRIPSRFFYKLIICSWELPETTFPKSSNISNSLDTDILPFPLLFSFKLAHLNQRTKAFKLAHLKRRGIPKYVDVNFHPLCIFHICQVAQDPFLKSWFSSLCDGWTLMTVSYTHLTLPTNREV